MPSRKVSVLVVDDDIRIVRMMQRILELQGYRVISANDGETALNLLEEESPDLILLDIMLPIRMAVPCVSRFASFQKYQ